MKTRKGYQTYPLTVAQRFHFFYADRCPKKEILNIGTSLTIETELDVEGLPMTKKKRSGISMWWKKKNGKLSMWTLREKPWRRRRLK